MYINGTISTGQDKDMHDALAAAMVSVGYVLVDTQVIGARTWKVYKSPAASNSIGKDFYLAISYSTTGWGGINIRPFEDYDVVNHLGIRGVTGTTAFSPETTFYSRYGSVGYALETNWMIATNYQLITQAASYGYYLSVTPDAIAGFTSTNSTCVYSGLMNLTAGSVSAQGSSAFPLVCYSPVSGNYYQTRYPKAVTGTVGSAGPQLRGSSAAGGPVFPGGQQTSIVQEFMPIELIPSASPLSSASIPAYRGTLKNLYWLGVDNTVGRGDTVTDGTSTYTLNGQSANAACYAVKQV